MQNTAYNAEASSRTIGSKAISLAAALLGIIAMGHADPAAANDIVIGKIMYLNEGGYTVNSVTFKWNDGTKTRSHTYDKDLAKDATFCLDLQKFADNTNDKLTVGSEVWIVIDIEAGDTQSCRHDNPRIFQNPAPNSQYYKTTGTTLNNNRCKLKDNADALYTNDHSSGNCDYW